jgi:hypothetical protein
MQASLIRWKSYLTMGILSSSSNSINLPVPRTFTCVYFISLFIIFYETDKDYNIKHLII